MTKIVTYAYCGQCDEIQTVTLTVERAGTDQSEVYECPIHGVIQTRARG